MTNHIRRWLSAVLALCLVFTLFGGTAYGASERHATAEEVAGEVYVKKAGGALNIRVYPGMTLQEGDWISTGPDGYLLLVTDRGDEIAIGENWRGTLSTLRTNGEGGTETAIQTWNGTMYPSVRKLTGPGSYFRVETANSVIDVRGTHFMVAWDPRSNLPMIIMYSGNVQIAVNRYDPATRAYRWEYTSEDPRLTPSLPPEIRERLLRNMDQIIGELHDIWDGSINQEIQELFDQVEALVRAQRISYELFAKLTDIPEIDDDTDPELEERLRQRQEERRREQEEAIREREQREREREARREAVDRETRNTVEQRNQEQQAANQQAEQEREDQAYEQYKNQLNEEQQQELETRRQQREADRERMNQGVPTSANAGNSGQEAATEPETTGGSPEPSTPSPAPSPSPNPGPSPSPQPDPVATEVTLDVSAAEVVFGEPFTITAEVKTAASAPVPDGGTVDFHLDSVFIGSALTNTTEEGKSVATLHVGEEAWASLAAEGIGVGVKTLSAAYAGVEQQYAGSTAETTIGIVHIGPVVYLTKEPVADHPDVFRIRIELADFTGDRAISEADFRFRHNLSYYEPNEIRYYTVYYNEDKIGGDGEDEHWIRPLEMRDEEQGRLVWGFGYTFISQRGEVEFTAKEHIATIEVYLTGAKTFDDVALELIGYAIRDAEGRLIDAYIRTDSKIGVSLLHDPSEDAGQEDPGQGEDPDQEEPNPAEDPESFE